MRKHPLALMDISLSHTALVLTRVPFTGQATQTEVTLDTIEQVRNGMVAFSEYYEREFYQHKWNR
jgi:hypothetical protein